MTGEKKSGLKKTSDWYSNTSAQFCLKLIFTGKASLSNFSTQTCQHPNTREHSNTSTPQHFNTNLYLRFILVLFSCISLCSHTLAQTNLIPNPGFEKYNGKGLYVPAAKPWKNIYTADYYHAPFKLRDDKKVEAHGGKSFVGLRFQTNYKEYVFVKLDSALKPGHHYTVEFWFCFGEWSTTALKSLGVCFSKKQLNQKQVEDTPAEFKSETGSKKGIISGYQWSKLTLSYTAIGGERFITIGNMAPKLNKDFKRIGKMFTPREAYYFMDDFSLSEEVHRDSTSTPKIDSLIAIEKSQPVDTFKTASAKDLKVGQIIKLHNVFFESGNAELLEESSDELDYIVQFLNENPTLEVCVNGHTDNSGYALNNQSLSDQRAFAVYNYLLRKKVRNTLSYKGYGARNPVATNSTPVGRARNRRVELEIIKK
jgi:outer membrane protein OmpA-like peptidoglycan-associated protein